MRAYVWTDGRLRRHAGRFVWLAINTEKAENAAFVSRYPVPALPTFLVIDPNSEKAVLRWTGGMTVEQVEKVFDDGEAAYRGDASGSAPATATGPDAALERADLLYGQGKYPEAAGAYREALAAAPAGWPSYGRTIESLMFSLSETDSSAATLELATASYARLKGTPSAASVAASALDASSSLPDSVADKKRLMTEWEARLRASLADQTVPYAGDDRSGYLITIMEAHKAAGDSVGARRVAEEWATTLERAAAEARTPEQRVVYDPHRLSAYIELGQPEKAIPMLEQSERDFPDDYNPPARLAIAYNEMKRWNDGLAASDRAMRKAYGPRKLRFYMTRADLYTGKGDVAGARKTLEDAIAYARTLPEPQQSKGLVASIQKRLDKLAPATATH